MYHHQPNHGVKAHRDHQRHQHQNKWDRLLIESRRGTRQSKGKHTDRDNGIELGSKALYQRVNPLSNGPSGNDGGKCARVDHDQEADVRRFHCAVKKRGPKLQETLRVRGNVMKRLRIQNLSCFSAQGADGYLIAVIGSTRDHIGQDGEENNNDKHNGQGVQVGDKLPLLCGVGKSLNCIGNRVCCTGTFRIGLHNTPPTNKSVAQRCFLCCVNKNIHTRILRLFFFTVNRSIQNK